MLQRVKLLKVLFILFTLLIHGAITSAQEDFVVKIGEDTTFTACNYWTTSELKDCSTCPGCIVEHHTCPSTYEADASANTGWANVTAEYYECGYKEAVVGITFTVQPGIINQPTTATVTVQYSWEVSATLDVPPPEKEGGGSAHAFVYRTNLVTSSSFPTSPEQVGVKIDHKGFVHQGETDSSEGSDTYSTTILLSPGEKYGIFFRAYAWADAHISGVASAYAKITMEKVSVLFKKPKIKVEPEMHYFGVVPCGGTSKPQQFSITNVGESELYLRRIFSPSPEFPLVNNSCSFSSLHPGGHCNFSIVFTPLTEGEKEAEVWIFSNDPDSPVTKVPLKGKAIKAKPVPEAVPGKDYLKFHYIFFPGSEPPVKRLPLHNIGQAVLEVGRTSVIGPGGIWFAIQNDNCSGQIIPPSGSCTLDVMFSPPSKGKWKATLVIPTNDPYRPMINIPLFGIAIHQSIRVPTDYSTIQEAIDAAAKGVVIQVAEGIYRENIVMKEGIRLEGGWNSEFTERDPSTYETIIDGGGSGAVVTFNNIEDTDTTIDGFTITNGNGDFGGGIDCLNSSPTISNNIIKENKANNGGGISCRHSSPIILNNIIIRNNTSHAGGGIACFESTPTISSNTVKENTANEHGGGLWLYASSFTVADNTIVQNHTAGDGGGISCGQSDGTIKNNKIKENEAKWGGGISCANGSSPSIIGNGIEENHSSDAGGGVHCAISGNADIENNLIAKNGVNGINCYYSSPLISKNIIVENDSCGIICSGNSSPLITNNLIGGNSDDAINISNFSSAVIVNNTIIKNEDGIDCEGSSQATLMNNIIVNNYESGIDVDDEANPFIAYNNVWSNGEDYEDLASPGTGDISVDPLFVDPDGGDYHLQEGSPCIDSGNPASEYNDLNFPPSKGSERNDMGCYGGPSATCIIGPVIIDCWVSTCNLSSSLTEICGAPILLQLGLKGVKTNIALVIAKSPSGQIFSLYDDGTHGDFESNDGVYSLMIALSNPPEKGEWIFRATTSDGRTVQRSAYLGNNNMPIPELVYPNNEERIGTTMPTLRWTSVLGSEDYWIGIWNKVPDPCGAIGEGFIWQSETDNTEITIPEGILTAGSYYWIIVANGQEDWQSSAAIYSFSVKKAQRSGDVDNDGDIDQNDLNILLTYRNQPASACPECDLDGDGVITVLDARKLVLMCTRPRCVTEESE